MPHVSYFWDEMEDNVVEEYDGDTGNTIATYTTEPTKYGSVLSQDRGGEKRYFQFDGQGNTTELTEDAGNVTASTRYTAFGEHTNSTGAMITPFGYGGRWGYHCRVSTTLYSIRRRQYDSDISRWLSVDPMCKTAIDIGRYAYVFVRNAPVTRVDPSGLVCISHAQPDVRQCGVKGKPPPWLLAWTAWIKMDKEGGTPGYLIQRITRTLILQHCCGNWLEVSSTCSNGGFKQGGEIAVPYGELPLPLIYYEAWPHWDGKAFDNGFESAHDRFGLDFREESKGIFHQTGELAFFPVDELPGGNNVWKRRDAAIGAGDLLVACPVDLPESFVKDFDKRVVASRGINITWICCPGIRGVLSFTMTTAGGCK